MKYITYFGNNKFGIEQYLPENYSIDLNFTTYPFTKIPEPANNCIIIVESGSSTNIDFDWLRTLKTNSPSNPIIIVSDQLNDVIMQQSIRSRVRDYVVLPDEHEYLTKLIKELFTFHFGSRNGREFAMIDPPKNKHIIHREKIHKTQPALIYIKKNYQQQLRVHELAKHCRMNKNYFARKFREEHGCTIREFIKQYRINEAMQLLSKTKLTIENIAYNVGFETISLFNRLFKQINGVSPSIYRQTRKDILSI